MLHRKTSARKEPDFADDSAVQSAPCPVIAADARSARCNDHRPELDAVAFDRAFLSISGSCRAIEKEARAASPACNGATGPHLNFQARLKTGLRLGHRSPRPASPTGNAADHYRVPKKTTPPPRFLKYVLSSRGDVVPRGPNRGALSASEHSLGGLAMIPRNACKSSHLSVQTARFWARRGRSRKTRKRAWSSPPWFWGWVGR